MLTLNQIRYYFTQFFENHYQINTVVYADTFDFSAKANVLYKVAHIQPVDPASINDKEIQFKFKITLGDIEDPNNQESENEIWSDCFSIANDFISYFGNDDFEDFFIDKNISIQRFSEGNTDRVAGVVFAFSVRQTRLNNICTLPLINPLAGVSYANDIPFVNGYYDLLSNYLTYSSASTLFQPKGNYLTAATVDLTNYYTKSQSDSKFLTGFTVDLSNYQLKGNYVSASTLSGYQIAGNYVSASTLNNYYTTGQTNSLFQPVGNYLTGITSGQVTAALGFNPLSGLTATTLSGYSISSGDTLFDNKYLSITSAAATFATYYTKSQSDSKYAATATTLAGYGIIDASPLGNDSAFNALAAFGSSIKGYTLGGAVLQQSLNVTLASGQTLFTALYVPKNATLSGVRFWIQASGVYTSNGYNGVGLYSVSSNTLTLVASSATSATVWKGAFGVNSAPFTTPYNASAGAYYVGLVYNNLGATADPHIYSINTSTGVNAYDFTNGHKSVGTANLTTLSATLVTSGITGSSSAAHLMLY